MPISFGTGMPPMFRIADAGELLWDPIVRDSHHAVLIEVDARLPEWIERSRAAGRTVPDYDPFQPIKPLR